MESLFVGILNNDQASLSVLIEMNLGSFYRSAIPQDITAGTPAPSGWGNPVAMLSPSDCGPLSTYFVNHSIVFDITFCGKSTLYTILKNALNVG